MNKIIIIYTFCNSFINSILCNPDPWLIRWVQRNILNYDIIETPLDCDHYKQIIESKKNE